MIYQEIILKFAGYMFEKFDLKYMFKANSWFMKVIAWFLHYTKIMDKHKFMNRYTTTISDTMYANFRLGDISRVSFPHQMQLISHECLHRLQDKNDILYKIKYLIPKYRAQYEMEAYGTSIKTLYFLGEKLPNAKLFANKLKSYKCTKYIDQAEKYFNKIIANIDNESYYNKVDIATREWIKNEM